MHDLQQQTTLGWHRAFGYNGGGIHTEFDKILVKMFARAQGQHVFEFPDDIRDALHHVQQVITATIVNSHAAYCIKNQRKAYQNRRADTELQWWSKHCSNVR